jgi:hypothetical protein
MVEPSIIMSFRKEKMYIYNLKDLEPSETIYPFEVYGPIAYDPAVFT